jgi:hypothetical protein
LFASSFWLRSNSKNFPDEKKKFRDIQNRWRKKDVKIFPSSSGNESLGGAERGFSKILVDSSHFGECLAEI